MSTDRVLLEVLLTDPEALMKECAVDYVKLPYDRVTTPRVIVAGSRTFNDYFIFCRILDPLLKDVGDVILVSGDASKGPDRMAIEYANDKGILCRKFPANWDEHGKSAGYIRNAEMAENAEILIAIWDGKSKGTRHMIDIAQRKGLKVLVFIVDCKSEE